MANNQKNNNENPLVSWVLTVVMLAVAWPVGLIMLFRMLTVGSITSPRKASRSAPIDVRATEVRDEPEPRSPRPAAQPRAARPGRTSDGAAERAPAVVGRHWGRGLIIAGAIVAGVFGFITFQTLVDLISYGYASYLLRELIYEAGLTATGLVLLFCGIARRKKAGRYRRYLTLIGRRDSLSIDTLARAVPVSYRRACDDLQDMLEGGYLPAGYLDAQNRRLVFSDNGIREEAPPQKPAASAAAQENDILVQIRTVNDQIADEAMSRKIDRIGEITGKILDYQRRNPDAADELHSFLSYYLPTTLKILRSYAQMEAQGVEGKNISSTKARIEGMMDRVVEGFEARLDQLFRSDAVDITSDIQVLEQMLQKDGLAGDPLFGADGSD